MTTPYQQRMRESLAFLAGRFGEAYQPEVCIVLGSGLSGVFPDESLKEKISFNDLPGFKATAVKGHSGDLAVIEKDGRNIVVLRGRVHGYEGYDPGEIVHNLRTMISWGAKKVLLTNAAGCLQPHWKVGEIMLITDQINATSTTPLAGDYGLGFGPRFVDMSQAYCPELQNIARTAFQEQNLPLREGVYCGVPGPAYESPAEVRMFQAFGASAVGMSTVFETLAARQLNARVLGLSCLTNYGTGILKQPLSHEEVLAAGKSFQAALSQVLPSILGNI